MATITFNSSTLGFTKGINGYGNIATAFTSAKSSTSKMVDSLNYLRRSLDVASVFTNVDTAIQYTDNTAYREEEKKTAISFAYRKMEQLFEDVGKVDNETAGIITKLKKGFYNKYKYLKPECEKGYWDKVCDFGAKLWKGVCGINEAIKDVLIGVCEWVKDHWKELLIGLVFIVAGALITAFTAGTGTAFWLAFGSALLKGLATAAISGLVSGTISGTVTFFGALTSGMSPGEAFSASLNSFGDGFASGFKTGGLSFFGQSLGCVVETYKGVKAVHTIATVADKLSTGTDVLEYGSKIVNCVAPNSWLANGLKSVTENPLYNKVSKGIGYVSAIFGAADKTAVVSKYDGEASQYLEEGIAVQEKNSPYILTIDKDGNKFYKHDNGSTVTEYKVAGKGILTYSKTESRIYNFKVKNIVKKIGKGSIDLVTGNNKYVPLPSSNNMQIIIEGIRIPRIDIPSINTSVLSL